MRIEHIIENFTDLNKVDDTFFDSLINLARKGGLFKSQLQKQMILDQTKNGMYNQTFYKKVSADDSKDIKSVWSFMFDEKGILKIEIHNGPKTTLYFRRKDI